MWLSRKISLCLAKQQEFSFRVLHQDLRSRETRLGSVDALELSQHLMSMLTLCKMKFRFVELLSKFKTISRSFLTTKFQNRMSMEFK